MDIRSQIDATTFFWPPSCPRLYPSSREPKHRTSATSMPNGDDQGCCGPGTATPGTALDAKTGFCARWQWTIQSQTSRSRSRSFSSGRYAVGTLVRVPPQAARIALRCPSRGLTGIGFAWDVVAMRPLGSLLVCAGTLFGAVVGIQSTSMPGRRRTYRSPGTATAMAAAWANTVRSAMRPITAGITPDRVAFLRRHDAGFAW